MLNPLPYKGTGISKQFDHLKNIFYFLPFHVPSETHLHIPAGVIPLEKLTRKNVNVSEYSRTYLNMCI